ncbi:MAG TPA: aldose 1-epimerase [Fimbriiglobus sp.]|jgi:aldose 1-epimerase
MTAIATPFTGTFGETTGPAVRLVVGPAEADVLPFLGFNCVRWDVEGESILFAEPPDTANPSPTRSGHPILFPFPNRIRGGQFAFDGRKFELPLNDSTKANAIHGFTPRRAWRVLRFGTDTGSAFVTGEFHLRTDAPESLSAWPADFILRVTYRLTIDALRVESEVINPDQTALPFGLGFHPYFRPPGLGTATIDSARLRIGTNRLWESADGLPTGRVIDAPDELRFDTARPIGPTRLDHVYTDLKERLPDNGRLLATLAMPGATRRLSIRADRFFRELVLFTPVHRRAIAIEPYTCATDAANLEGRGISSGWQVLPPGGQFTAAVDYRLEDET